jgi:UDPglucose 6-dehydrogenase
MRIAVVGTGYVGLVLGACLAENGNTVACVDKDQSKVDMLKAGQMPIYEPGLEEMVRRNDHEERLTFTTDLPEAVRASTIVFIAVGTPQGEDGSADLQHVMAVASDIGRAINKYTVVVDKSTVPVGTAKQVRAVVAKETKHPFAVVSNPEFLKQGAAVEDSMKPDRVVVGFDPGDDKAGEIMRELYAPFTRTGAPIMMMDTASAELCKYAANAMLATKISFMNEVANLCELVGADVDQVRKAIGADRRIGSSFLFPGVGYGGSCFPKDVKALIKSASDPASTARFCSRRRGTTGERAASRQARRFGGLSGKPSRCGDWRLPRTDDIAKRVGSGIDGCSRRRRSRFDPAAAPIAKKIFGDRIALCERSYDALNGADALAIVTEWNEFREPDFDKMKSLLKSPVVFDGRNIYTPEQMRALGFTYFSIGR